MTWSFQLHYGPVVDSVSNRNEYQESSWGKGRPAHKAEKPHRHLWADCLENVGASTSHNRIGLHGLLQG
jgi:hypothetical protein